MAETTLAAIVSSSSKSVFDEINADVLAVITLFVGIPICFYGKKIWKYIVFMIGFVAVSWVTYTLCSDNNIREDITLYLSLGLGTLAGGILFMAAPLAIFTSGVLVGILIAQFVISILSDFDIEFELWSYALIVAGFSLLCGFLIYKLWENCVIFVTALIGGFMFSSASLFLLGQLGLNVDNWFNISTFLEFNEEHLPKCDEICYSFVGLWLFLFFCGSLHQYGMLCKLLCGNKNEATIEPQNTMRGNRGDKSKRNPETVSEIQLISIAT